jgi:hypothetical protein
MLRSDELHNNIVAIIVDGLEGESYRLCLRGFDLMDRRIVFIGHANDEYTKALSVAEKELARLNAEAEAIAQRRAQLQQTISTLKTLTNGSEQEERTLTDAIRIIVKAADGYISAAEVLKSAYSMGAKLSGKNPKASIVTILGRLVRDGELERERGTIKVRFRSKYRAAL